ncbi:hypothetical protein [Methylobacterium sp. sgz302541]|uniref:hypothetical protein n=1 Tax=unclassified Methylobacterium TaxID=2615210 RepID=UPI003D3254EB
MAELFSSGRVVELILALVAVEGAALLALHRLTGRGPSALPLACNLAAGAALMLALRAALVGAPWTAVAGWLLAALAAHAAEMVWRLRRPGPSPQTIS